MKPILAAFAAGLLFGVGLTVSQMINPAKVLAFLDIFGNWDPTLAFVMLGALVVTTIGYRVVLRRPAPYLNARYLVPTRRDADSRLVSGAVLFGVGWGLAGYCPGPAITTLGFGAPETLVFVAAMLAGMLMLHFVDKWRAGRHASSGATVA